MSTNKFFNFSICVINQWALDFAGNTRRILESIKRSVKSGSSYRLGSELELSGYGCQDHFYESDTCIHSWECLGELIKSTSSDPTCQDIICDIGMPVRREGLIYNCRIILLNGNLLLIRPQLSIPNYNDQRKYRWFSTWPQYNLVTFQLPQFITELTKDRQRVVLFGDAVLRLKDPNFLELPVINIGLQMCNDLRSGVSPCLSLYNSSVDIVFNTTTLQHELGTFHKRIDLVTSKSKEGGGRIYASSNLLGCDAGNTYYDGGVIIAADGELITFCNRFSLREMENCVMSVNLDKLEAMKYPIPAGSDIKSPNYIDFEFNIFGKSQEMCLIDNQNLLVCCGSSVPDHLLTIEEEISLGPALWLWDILRRSGAGGFFLCLSGGIDSSCVACIVYSMCQQVVRSIVKGNEEALLDCRKITKDSSFSATSPRELCSRIFTTCYMPSLNSTSDTRRRAAVLASIIGSRHIEIGIDGIISSLVDATVKGFGKSTSPRFAALGGSRCEDLALQNVQARSRLTLSYLAAQLLPWADNLSQRSPLILSSANLDEEICGYFTKYDCSSADVNPLGGLGKGDVRRFVAYSASCLIGAEFDAASSPEEAGSPLSPRLEAILHEVLKAPPSAELAPLDSRGGLLLQTDEEDIGLTYPELALLRRLRSEEKCGPHSMLCRLLSLGWPQEFTDRPTERALEAKVLARKVMKFFLKYSVNRHKSTVLPPAYNTASYSTDDSNNKLDLRPFIYPVDWEHQFKRIDELVRQWEISFSK